jgi:RND family efflux transporter MFP subunit
MFKENNNKLVYAIIAVILLIIGFLFRTSIISCTKKVYHSTINFFTGTKHNDENEKKSDDMINNVESLTCVSIPVTEKLRASGVASRESIKIIADNFKEVEYVIPKNHSYAKKGDILVKYKTKELELRAEKLTQELTLKNQILERNKNLEIHNAVAKDELDKLRIEVASAQGELNQIKHHIEESTKIAPFNCLVKHHGIISGSFISNGQEVLTIFRQDKLFVEINISLKDFNELNQKDLLGKMTRLQFNGRRTIKGKVVYFLNNADPYAAALSAIIEMDDPDNQITSGEICEVKIYTGVLKRYFSIPEEAICGDDYDQHVFVIKDRIAYKTPVVRHGKKGEKILVSGLVEGDIIATSGAHRLNNLSKVRV